jgi:tRNA(Ile)-lysidine synthase
VQIAVNPAYLQRFRDSLANLGDAPETQILLAVSGGPDSIALLVLANDVAAGRIRAATIDHQLRPEAAAEAVFVRDICSALGVPHVTLSPAQKITGNIQSAARSARYALLEGAANEYGCSLIATAHHGDDQLETVLMRLARGSGVGGLAAIRHRNGCVIRPMLGFSKSELEEICIGAGIAPVRDPSNDNADFDRVRVRQWLAETSHPLTVDRVGRSAFALAEASEALQWATNTLSATRIFMKEDIIQCDATGLPRELQRRLLMRCLSALEPALRPRGDAIDRLLNRLEAGGDGMIGNIQCKASQVWEFSAAPPRGHAP